MDQTLLDGLDAATLGSTLARFMAAYVNDPALAAQNHDRVAELTATLTDVELSCLLDALRTVGTEQRLYPADPAGRRIARRWCEVLLADSTTEGLAHLDEAARRGPTVVVCNHLSYIDTTATDLLLAHRGHAALADRLVAVAGPKVYADLFRRFAAACLNTLPAPQSTQLEGTARLPPRELARQALQSVALTHEAIESGYIPLVYPEGSRSRTGHLRPFLKAVHRYLEVDGVSVVPLAITGTNHVFPVDAATLNAAPVSLRFGAPVQLGTGRDAREGLIAAHQAIAALLPSDYQPLPDDPAVV